MKNTYISYFILIAFLLFACEDVDTSSKESTQINNQISSRQSSMFDNIESIRIDNGVQCENNILIFPSWDSFEETIDALDALIESHCDNFEQSANPALTDEEYEALSVLQNFNEDAPLLKFEQDLEFCSLRKKIDNQENLWLALQQDGEWNESQDPDNHFIDDETERALYSEKVEVIIGTKEDGYIYYKFLDDVGNWIEVYNMDLAAITQVSNGVIPQNNPNVLVVKPDRNTQESSTAACRKNVIHRKYFSTGSTTRIKTVDKSVDFKGAPSPIKSSKLKSKTKYYRKKLGIWTRGKTTLTAGFEGIYNRRNYFQDWRECGQPYELRVTKTRKRSKVKIKHKGDSHNFFKVENDKIRGIHKRRQDVIKKIDYFDGDVI